MKRNHNNVVKWFFLMLFAMYVSGISLFTHRHVINNITYVHSHPFKRGEAAQHDHTDNALCLLDHIYSTSITPDIIPEIVISGDINPITLFYPGFYEAAHLIQSAAPLQLRAPPLSV